MTSRRTFLTQAGLVTAGVLLGPKLLLSKARSKVNLQLYTLREQLPNNVSEVIGKVSSAGYSGVETYGYSKANGFWGMKPAEFKALLKKNNLTSPSGHYGIYEIFAEGKLDEVKDFIGAAKTLGQEYITVPYLGDNFRRTPDDFKKIAGKLNDLGQLCKQSGIKLAYHNHDFEFKPVDGVILYDVLQKETDPALVKLELDLYWVVRAGHDPIKIFQQQPQRVTMVHVKDMDKAEPRLNTEVGKGSIDFGKILTSAKASGVKHFIVEQENFAIDPYQSIGESLKYIQENFSI